MNPAGERRGAPSSGAQRRATRGIAAALAILVCAAPAAFAAGGSPQMALVRATPYRSSSAAITLEVEGSFNFDDAVQLPLPIDLLVVQGNLTARFDLIGNVFTTAAGASEQSVAGPGVIAVKQHSLLVVLPAGFGAGAATVQLVAHYQGAAYASNPLGLTL